MSAFWIGLLSDVEVRNRLSAGPVADVQELIDKMEGDTPHDQLPPHYDWLVALRNMKQR